MEAYIILLVGLVFTIVSLSLRKKTKFLKNTGVRTDGIVYDIVEDSQSATNKTKYPIIRFVDANKDWITEESQVGGFLGQYKKGQQVNVIYEKDNPKNFMVDNPANDQIIYFILIAGIIMIVGALIYLISVQL